MPTGDSRLDWGADGPPTAGEWLRPVRWHARTTQESRRAARCVGRPVVTHAGPATLADRRRRAAWRRRLGGADANGSARRSSRLRGVCGRRRPSRAVRRRATAGAAVLPRRLRLAGARGDVAGHPGGDVRSRCLAGGRRRCRPDRGRRGSTGARRCDPGGADGQGSRGGHARAVLHTRRASIGTRRPGRCMALTRG